MTSIQRASRTAVGHYLVLKSAGMARGAQLSDSDIEAIELPSNAYLDKIAVADKPSIRAYLVLRRSNQKLAQGDLLLWQYFTDDPSLDLAQRIAEGNRAISIPVSSTGAVANFVEPESRVDLMGVFDVPGAKPSEHAEIVASGVRILAVGTAATRSEYERGRGYSSVTIEVSTADAGRIVACSLHARGGLSMALRPPGASDRPPIREAC